MKYKIEIICNSLNKEYREKMMQLKDIINETKRERKIMKERQRKTKRERKKKKNACKEKILDEDNSWKVVRNMNIKKKGRGYRL